MRLLGFAIGLITIVGLLAAGATLLSRGGEIQTSAQFIAPDTGDLAGFARATGPQPFDFPADHGPHPDYQTEWWYYTGNLADEAGHRFGYQLTFFRRALTSPAGRTERVSNWAAEQVYMAHFALTDVDSGQYHAFERLARGAAGIAGAQSPPYRVWLEDWSVEESGPGTYRMYAAQGDLALDLALTDIKGPALHGNRGYSQKGTDPGNASYYYSLTRLESTGTVETGGSVYRVNGLSWMDHEYSTSALDEDQVGWNWFALHLDDGTELKVFHIREEDGQISRFSSGSFIDTDGSVTHLARDDFTIEESATWTSPHTGAVYPARWTVAVPALALQVRIEPYLADQELNVSYAYWEGAVRVEGVRAGETVRGTGYAELTGYAGSMQGQF